MAVKSPVDLFKEDVRRLSQGTTHVYHIGNLQEDRQGSPSLNNIAIMAYGLHLIGKVGLRQRRTTSGTEYALKVLQPINPIDFDRARRQWLESLKETKG